jgi:AraC-like DNA-binding protein
MHLCQITGVPIRCLDATGQVTLFQYGYSAEGDPVGFPPLRTKLLSTIGGKNKPAIETGEGAVMYAVAADRLGVVVILGPVSSESLSDAQIAQYARAHGVSPDGFYIKKRSLRTLTSAVSILYAARNGKTLDDVAPGQLADDAPTIEVETQGYFMDIAENDIIRLDYERERIFLSSIRDGVDITSSAATYENMSIFETQTGILSNNIMKHYEYNACAMITLATRAAIDGGVDPATAYAVSDLLLKRLEKCRTPQEMFALLFDVHNSFARQVRLVREKRGTPTHVEMCMRYIGRNLNRPITPDDMARAVNLHKAHLSRLFMKATGESLMGYLRRQRVEAAKNMLKYSIEPIPSIASYLCFPTQSHFGKVFKDVTGVTPGAYRAAERVIELRAK